ncbi:hypothetical protein C2E23DRAFT_857714 [Lenzites betulinus]|nr:hypothetical protein C2E23DRAFT_857714 [Lenzites betulinus]
MSGARNNNSDNVDKTLFLPDVPRRRVYVSYDPDRATPFRGATVNSAIDVDAEDFDQLEPVRGRTVPPGSFDDHLDVIFALGIQLEFQRGRTPHRGDRFEPLVEGDRLSLHDNLEDCEDHTSRKLLFPSAITTASFLADVLDSRISMVAMLQSAGYERPDLTIPEADLRALFMKALLWFIERECLSNVLEARVVLVGRADGESLDDLSPSLSLGQLQAIAAQLPEALTSDTAQQDFDTFMFHAGRYFKKRSLCSAVVLVVHLVLTVFVVYFAIHATIVLAKLMF